MAAGKNDVIKLLLKAVDKLPLESLRVQRSPVARGLATGHPAAVHERVIHLERVGPGTPRSA